MQDEILNDIITSALNEEEVSERMSYRLWLDMVQSKGYRMATDDDFVVMGTTFMGSTTEHLVYIGSDEYVIIPRKIHGRTVVSYYRMFSLNSSPTVKGVAAFNPEVEQADEMFRFSLSKSMDLSYLITKNIRRMSMMFAESRIQELNLLGMNTKNVETMSSMFKNLNVKDIDVSHFDTLNVVDMHGMFQGTTCETLDLSSFDTSNVEDMAYMFQNSKARKINIQSFNTRKVINMREMFTGMTLENLDLTHFDTSNVEDMSWMFASTKFSSLNISTFDTKNVKDMEGMFAGADFKTSPIISHLLHANVESYRGMLTFMDLTPKSIHEFDLSQFDISHIEDTNHLFTFKPEDYTEPKPIVSFDDVYKTHFPDEDKSKEDDSESTPFRVLQWLVYTVMVIGMYLVIGLFLTLPMFFMISLLTSITWTYYWPIAFAVGLANFVKDKSRNKQKNNIQSESTS